MNFYVSAKGIASGTGEYDSPFPTIQRGMEEVRKRLKNPQMEDIHVYIMEGEYNLEEPLQFDESDSGRDGYQVIYKNYESDKVIISGGVPVKNWELVDKTKNIYRAKIESGGIVNACYENGKRCRKARFPKQIQGIYPYGKYALSDLPVMEAPERRFRFFEGDIPYVRDISQLQVSVWAAGFGGFNWYQDVINITDIDYKTRVVTLGREATYAISAGSRYFVQGSIEFLTDPGEFHYNIKSGYLYYIPIEDTITLANIEQQNIICACMGTVLDLKGQDEEYTVHDIIFDGLIIRNSDVPVELCRYQLGVYQETPEFEKQQSLIMLQNTEHITIRNCSIHNSGWCGVEMYRYNQYNTVSGCHIFDTGFDGIYINVERGDLSSYINHHHTIYNNEIHDVGCVFGHGACIELVDSGDNQILHNRLYNAPRAAVQTSSLREDSLIGRIAKNGTLVTKNNVRQYQHLRNNYVAYNEVTNVNCDSQDTGALESWCPGYGNRFENNAVHDTEIHFSFGNLIYLDDMADEFTVKNNLLSHNQNYGKGTLGNAISVKGAGCVVENNVIADNHITGNGVIDFGGFDEYFSGDHKVFHNVAYQSGGALYSSPRWQKEEKLTYADENVIFTQEGVYRVAGMNEVDSLSEFKHWHNHQYEQHTLTDNPGFMNPENSDYRFAYNSIVYALGIEDLDMASIGLTEEYPFQKEKEELNNVYLQADVNGNKTRGWISLNDSNRQYSTLTPYVRTKSGYLLKKKAFQIIYSTSDTAIATVNNRGRVKAISKGTAMITATVTNGLSQVRTTLQVLVNDQLSTLCLLVPRTRLSRGESTRLKAVGVTEYGQYLPLHRIEMISESDIITVSTDGVVTAVSEGTGIIWVKGELEGVTLEDSVAIVVSQDTLRKVWLQDSRCIFPVGSTCEFQVMGEVSTGEHIQIPKECIEFKSSKEEVAFVDEAGHLVIRSTGRANLQYTVRYLSEEISKAMTVYTFDRKEQSTDYAIHCVGACEGAVTETKAGYEIISTGENVYGNTDDFSFLSIPQKEEVNELVMTINAFEKYENGPFAGIMIRESLEPDSRNITLRVNENGELCIGRREHKGAVTIVQELSTVDFPCKIKLQREVSMVFAFIEKESSFIEVARVAMKFPESAYFGAAVFSRNQKKPVRVGVSCN